MSNFLKKAIKKTGDLIGDFGDWYSGKDAMKYQNQLARENWEMQNAYNTPSAQMARYAEAGLNPNLIYGQSNTAGAIAAPGQPESGASQIDKAAGTIASFFSTKAMLAEIANKKKQNSLLQSQADYVKEQTRGQRIENQLKKLTVDSVGSGGNPNDPYWYRDFKKIGRWLLDQGSKLNVSSTPASPSVDQRVTWNGIPVVINWNKWKDDLEKQRSRLPKGRVQWNRKDRGGR